MLPSVDLAIGIAERMRKCRLEANLSQAGLAARAGISMGSLKRFEDSGQISLDRLIRLALVLGAASRFEELFRPEAPLTLDELLESKGSRRRGRQQ